MVADSTKLEEGSYKLEEQGAISWGSWRRALLGPFAAVLYCSVSISMTFINKWAMQLYGLPMIVLIFQMLATVAIIHPLLILGIIEFPRFSFQKAWVLLPVTALYTANTAFSLSGLRTLNIPMYNVLKRLTPVVILVIKAGIQKRWPRTQITASVVMVVGGCIVAGLGDLGFDLTGYAYALTSCVLQSFYLLLVEFKGAAGTSTNELLYYNAISAVPLLVIMALVNGEAFTALPELRTSVTANGLVPVSWAIVSCSTIGCLLNYAMFLCTVNNTALTTTIVGVLKGVIATVLGFFFLGGVKFSALNVSGISLNTAGSIWYTTIKYREKQEKKAARGDRDMELLTRDEAAEPLLGGAAVAPSRDDPLPISSSATFGRQQQQLQQPQQHQQQHQQQRKQQQQQPPAPALPSATPAAELLVDHGPDKGRRAAAAAARSAATFYQQT